MTNNNNEWRCIKEDTLSHHEAQIETLNTKNQYKHEKIQEILDRQKTFETKLDKILEELHQQKLDSAKDDFSIDNRVTSLENTVRVLKWAITIALTILTTAITVLTFILTNIQ